MKITFENDIKKINGRTLDEVLEGLSPGDKRYETLRKLFLEVNNLNEFKSELKKLKPNESTTFMLLIMGWLCGYSIEEGYEILEEISDGE